MKHSKIVWILLLATPKMAHSEEAKVIFFGGSTSTKSVMSACYPHSENFGYHASAHVKEVVKEINSHPSQNYIVAGHSSGAKYANSVARKVARPQQITLVDLDGYAPRKIPSAVKRVCWNATNGRGLSSRNANSMTTGNNCQIIKTQTAPSCRTKWCLHFSIINLNVPGNLNNKTWISQGYRNCAPNMNWAKP